jgi:hypothetical protein
MTAIVEPITLSSSRAGVFSRSGNLAIAGAASLGAGAIHAAAVGVHNEHAQAVRMFVAIAVFQIAWGALGVTRGNRTLAAIGALGNAGLIGGWLLAKTSGISFINGLEQSEPAQFADTLAAAFAAVAVIGAVVSTFATAVRPRHTFATVALVAIGVLTVPGMVRAGSHGHAGHEAGAAAANGDEAAHDHDTDAAAAAPLDAAAAPVDTAHDHGDDAHAAGDDAAVAAGDDTTDTHADHEAPSVVPPKPYIPTQPIDLSGVEGVSLEQQAEAENLIAITLLRLPKFADVKVAESLGWQSIGDGPTGHEHYINWDLINDDDVLNPDMPESLVYEVDRETGDKTLVSAMFMYPESYTLDTVPEFGGELIQWHIHNNLCFTSDPDLSDEAPQVRGITNSDGTCNAPLFKLGESPMIHVWITPHPCGPFAALEGAGAGQVKPGEEHACDHAHGDTGTFG